jgi:hypothetical protein
VNGLHLSVTLAMAYPRRPLQRKSAVGYHATMRWILPVVQDGAEWKAPTSSPAGRTPRPPRYHGVLAPHALRGCEGECRLPPRAPGLKERVEAPAHPKRGIRPRAQEGASLALAFVSLRSRASMRTLPPDLTLFELAVDPRIGRH